MARMLLLLILAGVTGCVSIDKQRPAIDQAMWDSVADEYGPAAEDDRVTSIGMTLAEHAPASEDGPASWAFVVLDDDEVQAFTTIDGKVALTRGLIERFDNDDELAAEVARQIAHARYQHLWSFMNNQISSAGFFIYPKGAATGLDEAKIEYASWLFHRGGVGFMHPFQAWQLIEADAAAVEMLEAAGFDPSAIEGPLRVSGQDGQYAYTYGHVRARRSALDD